MNHEDHSLLKPDEDSPNNIVNKLNNFCLLEIFNRLDIIDLCSVANLCKRFNIVAQLSFSTRYKTFEYPGSFPYTFQPYGPQMRRVLCTFGHLIHSLYVTDFKPATMLSAFRAYEVDFEAISKYCAGTLKELETSIFLYSTWKCDLVKPLFASLEKLKMGVRNCKFIGDANSLFNECTKLKVLIIDDVEFMDLLAHNIPNLEELYISHIIRETSASLLQLNSQIKKLKMYVSDANRIMCPFASEMGNLQELILSAGIMDGNWGNINELGKLKSLKFLELHDIDAEFVPAIEAIAAQKVPLERLVWHGCPLGIEFLNSVLKLTNLNQLSLQTIDSPFDDLFTELGKQLPQLKELKLWFKHGKMHLLSIGGLKSLIEHAPKLSILTIHTNDNNFIFDQKAYDTMLAVIRKRSDENKLTIIIYQRQGTTVQMQSNLLKIEFFFDSFYDYEENYEELLDYEDDDDEYAYFDEPFDSDDSFEL